MSEDLSGNLEAKLNTLVGAPRGVTHYCWTDDSHSKGTCTQHAQGKTTPSNSHSDPLGKYVSTSIITEGALRCAELSPAPTVTGSGARGSRSGGSGGRSCGTAGGPAEFGGGVHPAQ